MLRVKCMALSFVYHLVKFYEVKTIFCVYQARLKRVHICEQTL